VEHCICIVPDYAPRAFDKAEHVVGIGSRELCTDTNASAHLPGRGGLKTRVRAKLDDGAKCARMRMMAYVQVTQLHKNVFLLYARVLLGLEEPHPHVVGMVIDHE
jgi:hypothetical protein